MRVVDSLSIIFAVLYITIVVLLSIFVVHPLATGKGIKDKIHSSMPKWMLKSKLSPINEKQLDLAIKAKAIPVLFHWYLGIIIFGISVFVILFTLENTILSRYSMPAILDTLLSTEDAEEEDDPYDWQFPDDPNLGNNEQDVIPGYSYYEGDLVAEIAMREYTWYKSNNIVGGEKYWKFYYIDVKGKSTYSGFDWCAGFVMYVLHEAGVAAIKGTPEEDEERTIPDVEKVTYGCTKMRDNVVSGVLPGSYHIAKKNGSSVTWEGSDGSTSYTPRVGDIVLYSTNSGSTCKHTAIVVDVAENGDVTTVGGNEGYSSGATDYTNSWVNKSNKGVGGVERGGYNYIFYWTPPYKMVTVNGYSGSFDISSYETDSSGLYSGETMSQIIYDFLLLEADFNSAAACGVLANMTAEGGMAYSVVEYAGKPYCYYDAAGTQNAFRVPTHGGNLNWVDVPDMKKNLPYTGKLYYWRNSRDGIRGYGMGIGLVMWSNSRRIQLLNFAEQNNYPHPLDAAGIVTQIAWIMEEMESGYKDTFESLRAVTNDADGAYTAAYLWHEMYEKSAGGEESARERGEYAKTQLWPIWGNTAPSTSVPDNSGGTTSSNISNATVIGDSNTVRMYNYKTAIAEAKNIFAIVGVSTGNWDSYTNKSSTTGGRTIKQCLAEVSSSQLSNIIIMLGTNDGGPANIANNLTEIVTYIRSRNSGAKISICTVPPVNDDKSPSLKNSDATAISEAIKDFVSSNASKYNLKLVDVNGYLSTSDMSTSNNDGYHLSSSGCEKCANYIATNF